MQGDLTRDEEEDRLATLYEYSVLDTEAEGMFDAAARLAALICQTPIALISFVSEDRQWFKAAVGLDACETPRDQAFCAFAIQSPHVMEIEDALLDPRFVDNPLVQGDPHIRFYAGAPLTVPGGHALGTLCVIDRSPRHLTPEQRSGLAELSRMVVGTLISRKKDIEEAARLAKIVSIQENLTDAELDLDGFLETVLLHMRAITPASAAILTVLDGTDLVIRSIAGDATHVHGRVLKSRQSLSQFCIDTKTIQISDDCANDPRVDQGTIALAGARSAIALPLNRAGDVFGCVLLVARTTHAFRSAQLEMLQLMTGFIGAAFEHRLKLDANRQLILERARSLEALAEVNERFRSAMVYSANGMAVIGLNGDWLQVNDALCRLLGYSDAELLTMGFQDITHPDDLQRDLDNVASVLNGTADHYQIEKRYRRKDGTYVWVVLAISLVRDLTHAPSYFISQVTDIDSRKKAEQALEETAQRLREANHLLVMSEELASIGHWYLDLATSEVRWSDEVFRIHGRDIKSGPPSLEEALNYYHPDDSPAVAAIVSKALENRTGFSFEFRIVRPDGRVRDISSWGQLGPEGNALFGLFQDITDQKSAEREQRRLNHRFRLATEAGRVGIWEWVIEEDRFVVDDATRRLFGIGQHALILTARDWIERLHPDDSLRVEKELQACLLSDTPFDCEYRIVWPSREVRHLHARGSVVEDPATHTRRMVGTYWDATEIRLLSLQLAAEKERAEAANQAKSSFLAAMSHEIRTPMNGVLGMNALLMATELSPHQRRLAEQTHHSAQALLAIIDDILDISKLEAGKVELEDIPFDLPDLVQKVVDLLQIRADGKGITLTSTIDERADGAFRGDPTRLRQILLNLVSNAVKFTDAGTIDIVVSARADLTGHSRLRLEVRDSGIGISDDVKTTLFQPFEQADRSITRRFGGTGLGLSICKRLVDLMGGDIGVTDRPGGGSVFWVELVMRRTILSESQVPSSSSPAATPILNRSGRILLAEDNSINIELVTLILEGAGYEVDLALDGVEAVRAAADGNFDLILMDMQMPDLDGPSATRRIRATEKGRQIPIIAMTANAMKEDRERCLNAGMTDYITKPFELRRLLDAVAQGISNAERSNLAATNGAAWVDALPIIDGDAVTMLRSFLPEAKFKSLLGRYLKETEAQGPLLEQLAFAESVDEIGREAHKIISSAGTFGARRVQHLAQRLQTACRTDQRSEIPELVGLLTRASAAALALLRDTNGTG
jgi:PAS domain S-box-containing protein